LSLLFFETSAKNTTSMILNFWFYLKIQYNVKDSLNEFTNFIEVNPYICIFSYI
jgi:hypothetical protein